MKMITDNEDDNDVTMNTIPTYESLVERYSSKSTATTTTTTDHIMRLESRTSLYRIVSNSLMVIQEISLSCLFLSCYQLAILRQQQQQMTHTTTATSNVRIQNLENEPFHKLEYYSIFFIILALGLIFLYSTKSDQTNQLRRSEKVRQRSFDSVLLMILLRFISSFVQSLTASYSTDTVHLLSYTLMGFHLLFCDYDYANGKSTHFDSTATSNLENNKNTTVYQQQQRLRRRPFMGGTFSLNAALFSTTLLVSRLENNHHDDNNSSNSSNNRTTSSSDSIITAYMFISASIAIFAFYPDTRHVISSTYPPYYSAAMWIITACIICSTTFLLIRVDNAYYLMNHVTIPTTLTSSSSPQEGSSIFLSLPVLYHCLLFALAIAIPLWKNFVLQPYKCSFRKGTPWDIPSRRFMQLDYRPPP